MPSNKLRRTLRAHGHHLDAVVQIGHEGVTEAVLRQIATALADHELIKVRLGTECPEDRFEVADRVAAASIQVVQIIGRVLLLYRRHPEHPQFE